MKLQIRTPDDSGKFYETELHTEYSYLVGTSVTPSSYRREHEPTIAAIKVWVANALKLNRKGVKNYHTYITLGDEETGLKLLVNKIGARYHLMGEMQSKDTVITAIARTIYKSCFSDDNDELYKYMLYHLRLPTNVSYALENRAPFHWYKQGKKIEVRFNVKMIGPDTCAMEISDGIWGQIPVKQMNIYMNYYWHGKVKGSWKLLSPKKLWSKIMKNEPTEGQLKMMIAFLQQNRTDDIVQSRALELVKSLEKQYSNRLAVKWSSNGTKIQAMAIRGKLADWIITDNEFKSDIQAVSTYVFAKGDGGNARQSYQTGILKGPICIDNMTRNSSVGDQFAARALSLLNDKITVAIVNTISRYMDAQHYDGQTDTRISFDEFRLVEWNKLQGE